MIYIMFFIMTIMFFIMTLCAWGGDRCLQVRQSCVSFRGRFCERQCETFYERFFGNILERIYKYLFKWIGDIAYKYIYIYIYSQRYVNKSYVSTLPGFKQKGRVCRIFTHLGELVFPPRVKGTPSCIPHAYTYFLALLVSIELFCTFFAAGCCATLFNQPNPDPLSSKAEGFAHGFYRRLPFTCG